MKDETRGGASARTREPWTAAEGHRLAGEEAPAWLAPASALLGTALAIAASFAWLDPSRMAGGPAVQAVRIEPSPSPKSASRQEQTKPAEPPEEPIVRQNAPDPASEVTAPEARPPTPQAATNENAEQSPRDAGQTEAGAPNCLPTVIIPFARNSARLTVTGLERDVAILNRWMAENQDATLSVEGHTDATGPEQYNVLLSYSRAKAAIAWLIGQGLPERRMIARAAGSSYSKDVLDGTDGNRRVVLRVEGVASCR